MIIEKDDLFWEEKLHKKCDNGRVKSNIFLGGDVSTRKKAFD